MKYLVGVIVLVSINAAAAENVKTQPAAKAQRAPASTKPGHFTCDDTGDDAASAQTFLEAHCDPAKSFSVNIYNTSGSYSNYSVCCIHK